MNFKKFFTNKEDNFVSLDRDFFRFIAECLLIQKHINKVDINEREQYQKVIDDCHYDLSCIVLNRDFVPKSKVLCSKLVNDAMNKYLGDVYAKR